MSLKMSDFVIRKTSIEFLRKRSNLLTQCISGQITISYWISSLPKEKSDITAREKTYHNIYKIVNPSYCTANHLLDQKELQVQSIEGSKKSCQWRTLRTLSPMHLLPRTQSRT